MRILIVYNRYRTRTHGEEAVVDNSIRLLREKGHEVECYFRSSEGIGDSALRKGAAAVAGIYNPFARQELKKAIEAFRPDVVHAHNLYPWISPSSLAVARRAAVPVVMTIHHFGLTCPALTHYRNGSICTLCVPTRELNCVTHNCRGGIVESGLYALRSALARKLRHFLDNVTVFIALNQFTKAHLVACGFPESQIAVRPNMVFLEPQLEPCTPGDFVGYVGRITPEKGVDVLCEAALDSRLPLRVAGNFSTWQALHERYRARVDFAGVLRGEELKSFYRQSRFIVIPSRSWDVCPMVALEAMNLGTPVVASRTGGLPELLQQGHAGVLVEPGRVAELSDAMSRLWNDTERRRQFSSTGRAQILECYSERRYLADLISIYERAVTTNDVRAA